MQLIYLSTWITGASLGAADLFTWITGAGVGAVDPEASPFAAQLTLPPLVAGRAGALACRESQAKHSAL